MRGPAGSFRHTMSNEALDFSLGPETVKAAHDEADDIVRKVLGLGESVELFSRDTYVSALQEAIRMRCPFATRTLWAKVDGLCGGIAWHEVEPNDVQGLMAPLAGQEKLRIDLLRFLVCFARVPTLVLALFKQHSYGPLDNCVIDRAHGGNEAQVSKGYWSHNLAALIATVMLGITHSRHPPEVASCEDAPVEVDPAWDHLLMLLLHNAHFPSLKPYTITFANRYNEPCAWSVQLPNTGATLLHVAILCSVTSAGYVHATLKKHRFSYYALGQYFAYALGHMSSGNDAVLLKVLRAIYGQILINPREPASGEGPNFALMRCWKVLTEYCPSVMTTHVCTDAEPEAVQVPYDALGTGCVWPPETFLAIVDELCELHLDTGIGGPTDDEIKPLLRLLRSALPYVLCEEKVYMLDHLVELICREGDNNDPLFLLHNDLKVSRETLFRLSGFPNRSFARITGSLNFENEEHTALVEDAWFHAVSRGFRHGSRALLDVLGKLPVARLHNANEPAKFKRRVLNLYTDLICGAEVNGLLERRASPAVRAAHYKEIREEYTHFLELGKPWEPDDLTYAVCCASEGKGGIAVGVLVSPPYNASIPEDDNFVAHIMRHVLAPGAPMVRSAQERFDTSAL